jgi:DNA polymerase I-like protein with 3'-5' exonuclease and polymerase domains
MAGLLKSLPPRATRQSDSAIVSKASRSQTVTPTVRGGGKEIYNRISTISAVVSTKLGKYADQYLLLRDEASVVDYFRAILENGFGALDTETDSLDPILCTLAGVCLYTPGQKPAYIPMHHISYVTGVESANQVEDSVVRKCLQECEDAGVKWIMHNAKFDIRVLFNKLNVTVSCYWDTMLAAKCLNENESAALKDLHLKYCKTQDTESLTYEKLFEGVPFTQIPISIGYLYSAGDTIKTWELYEFQKKHLNRRNLPGPFEVFRNIEMPLIPIVADMENTGITLDMEFAQRLSDKYNAILKEREAKFYEVLSMYSEEIEKYKAKNPNHKLSDPVSINSPTQIAIILYDILGLTSPDPKKPRGTGEDILLALNVPLSQAILDYRETAKLLSTYVDKLPTVVNQKTGRIHCTFNQYGAATGRFSSSDPNMQNIPSHNKEIRRMFRAAKGHVLISCDFSQQEPRILAHCSNDQNLIDAYKTGKDIYAWIASFIYKVPYDECKEFRPDGTTNPEGKKRRSSVKNIILGIMYRRGAKAIAEQLNCSTKEAQKIIDQFYDAFPKVREWMDKTMEKARKTGYVETVWGRKRRLPDLLLEPYEFQMIDGQPAEFDPLSFDAPEEVSTAVPEKVKAEYIKRLEKAWSMKDKRSIILEAKQRGISIKDNGGFIADAERQCINSIIQGSSADLTKIAMIAIGNSEYLKERKCKLLLQVHDEVIAECPEEYAKECAEELSRLMVEAAKGKIKVPMKCDAEISRVWYGEAVSL